jgi:hypothetical protein
VEGKAKIYGRGYSSGVNNRRYQGINSVRSVFNLSEPRPDIPPIPAMKVPKKALVRKVWVQRNPLQSSLENIINKAINLYPDEIGKGHPEILTWYKTTSSYIAGKKRKRRRPARRRIHTHGKKIR